MTAFIIRRLFQGFLVLCVATAMIYFVLTLIPGGPLTGLRQPGSRITQADITRMGFQMGINDAKGRPYPWYQRYFTWIFSPDQKGIDVKIGDLHIKGGGIVTGNWGNSIVLAKGRSVMDQIMARLPFTLVLMTSALIISLIIALPIGIISAVKQYSRLDYTVTFLSFFGISMPVFWFGWMLIIIFAVKFKEWGLPALPPSGAYSDPSMEADIWDRTQHLILPIIVLSLLQVAGWSRYLRAQVLEVLRLDYVRTAWAKGLAQRAVILKHALRNALIPLITVVTLAIPGLFTGAIITETIFSYPGMGSLYINAVGAYDWPLVMGILLIATALTVGANLLADVLYAVADPRIRYS